MASLTEFETTLKEVVGAKRVSASKMTSLTESALKSMDNDTKLVSILYRTHKSLPTAAKVSSLYAFDALARAARSKVIKHNLTGDLTSEKGNCATFLLRIEGVLDGLFQDMVVTGTTESKEKSKKILDIWTKSSTFSPAVLTRLKNVVKDAEKETDKAVTTPPVADPRTANQISAITTPTPPIPTPPLPVSASAFVDPVQTTLLALLSQAANGGLLTHTQTPPNTTAIAAAAAVAAQPQLDPVQFALLQQLAQTAKQGGAPSQSLPGQPAGPSTKPGSAAGSLGGPSHTSPSNGNHDNRYETNRIDPRLGRYDNQARGRGRGDFHDDQTSHRGSFRGAGFRGRGRGNLDDRDRSNNRDGYRSPPSRPRRSRSRSPPGRFGGGGRRDVKPYSPSQRQTLFAQNSDKAPSSHSADSFPVSSAVGAQKDEFGRDIRPQSPEVVEEKPAQPPILPSPVDRSVPAPAIASNQIPSVQQQIPSAPAANTSSQIDSVPAAETTSQPGLDKFDMSTFDFTAPSSWEALGKMWQVTYGYLPSQEDLMQLVMSGGMVAGAAAAGMIPGQYPGMAMGMQAGWQQFGGGWGEVPNQGVGGPGYGQGHVRNNQQRGPHSTGGYQQGTDAIVLGGGDDSSGGTMQVDSTSTVQMSPSSGEGGAGGRMQRVGDKWVFVRDAVST